MTRDNFRLKLKRQTSEYITMRTEQVLEATIDIDDPIGFAANSNSMIGILKERFEGKCYSRCLILEVLRVEQQSYLAMCSVKYRHVGSVSVKFTARVLTCDVGSTLHGCKVVKVDPKFVLCKYKELSIKANKKGPLAVVNEGWLVSVVVLEAVYQLGDITVFIRADPYVRSAQTTWMKVRDGDLKMTPAISAAQTIVDKAVIKADAAKLKYGKAWQTFEEIYFPFKTHEAQPLTLREKPLSSLITAIRADILVARASCLQSAPTYYETDECPAGDQQSNVLTTEQTVVTLLLDYASYLRDIRKTCEVYGTKELLTQHINMFAAIKQSKVTRDVM